MILFVSKRKMQKNRENQHILREDSMIVLDWIKGGDPFAAYPALRGIWPSNHQRICEEITAEDLAKQQESPELFQPPIFLIVREDPQEDPQAQPSRKVVGLTGFFFVDPTLQEVHLRWHGIIEEERGKGYSEAALRLVEQAVRHWVPSAKRLVESVPGTSEGPAIAAYFQKRGYTQDGPAEWDEYFQHDWTSWSIDLHPQLTPTVEKFEPSESESSKVSSENLPLPLQNNTESSAVPKRKRASP